MIGMSFLQLFRGKAGFDFHGLLDWFDRTRGCLVVILKICLDDTGTG